LSPSVRGLEDPKPNPDPSPNPNPNPDTDVLELSADLVKAQLSKADLLAPLTDTVGKLKRESALKRRESSSPLPHAPPSAHAVL